MNSLYLIYEKECISEKRPRDFCMTTTQVRFAPVFLLPLLCTVPVATAPLSQFLRIPVCHLNHNAVDSCNLLVLDKSFEVLNKPLECFLPGAIHTLLVSSPQAQGGPGCSCDPSRIASASSAVQHGQDRGLPRVSAFRPALTP